MTAFRERNDPLRLMGRRLLLAALAIIVISASWGVWNIYRKERESARLNTEAQARLADLQKRQTQLQADYDTLQTARGQEEALRQQYALGKRGEGLIVIVEPPKPAPIQATSSIMQWLKDIFSHL